MNIPTKKILKILGYIFIPLVPMTIGAYFLFPYINEEKYQRVVEKYDTDFTVEDTTGSPINMISEEGTPLGEQETIYQHRISKLKSQLDSLNEENDSLRQALSESQKELDSLRNSGSEEGISNLVADNAATDGEAFSEKIKSLLDLEEEDLTPILSNMNDQQLVRIFKVGSDRQRKKLLRSLESKRVAKLMREVL